MLHNLLSFVTKKSAACGCVQTSLLMQGLRKAQAQDGECWTGQETQGSSHTVDGRKVGLGCRVEPGLRDCGGGRGHQQ
jgi:hypothetical protein